MADKSKKKNIFSRIAQVFKEVRSELKKAVWPTKEKLRNTSAVVLAVILFFAIFLSVISSGGRWVLEKVGFYDEVEVTETEATEVTAATEATTEATEETEEAQTEAAEETAESEA